MLLTSNNRILLPFLFFPPSQNESRGRHVITTRGDWEIRLDFDKIAPYVCNYVKSFFFMARFLKLVEYTIHGGGKNLVKLYNFTFPEKFSKGQFWKLFLKLSM